MIRVTENFRKIQDLLVKAATEAGRRPDAVHLLAASKTQSPETVLEAASAGQRDFGENFAREGIEKMTATGRDDLIWHFIPPLHSCVSRHVSQALYIEISVFWIRKHRNRIHIPDRP